jgi:hypothetical protein
VVQTLLDELREDGRQPGVEKTCRAYLRGRGVKAVIPVKEDQKANRLRRGQGRRQAAGLWCRVLQGAQHHRAVSQQAQGFPGRWTVEVVHRDIDRPVLSSHRTTAATR